MCTSRRSKSRPACSSIELRWITSRPGAVILTMPGYSSTDACGLSAWIASMMGRVSLLAWKAMKTGWRLPMVWVGMFMGSAP